MRKADRNKTGVVFNIQKFSINDGPGIRTVVFLKGCPLRCRWCSNPESQLAKVQVLWDTRKCISCHHCIQVCPQKAVSSVNGNIRIHYDLCNGCGVCVKECPGHALEKEGGIRTVKEVIASVKQDMPFYEESGGGMTLSGGEMLAQPDFSSELFLAAKEEGIQTCCETTGMAKPEVFKKVIENIDIMLFDVKHWNAEKHREYTGVTDELPTANLKYALSIGKNVLPRIPVIPGFNDSLNDAEMLSRKLHHVGAERCQLLPFHQFGENKYSMLSRNYAYQNVPALHKEDLQEYLQIFRKNGIDAFF